MTEPTHLTTCPYSKVTGFCLAVPLGRRFGPRFHHLVHLMCTDAFGYRSKAALGRAIGCNRSRVVAMLRVAEEVVEGFYNPFPDRPQMTRAWSTARTKDLGPELPRRLPARERGR